MYLRLVLTTCPYCGVECNLMFKVLDRQIIGTLPAKIGQIFGRGHEHRSF